MRGISFEFQRKIDDPRWRSAWRWSLTLGSRLVPLLLGTAFGDMLHGLAIDQSHNYTGDFVGLLVPYGLYTGVTLTVLCLFLGAHYSPSRPTGNSMSGWSGSAAASGSSPSPSRSGG